MPIRVADIERGRLIQMLLLLFVRTRIFIPALSAVMLEDLQDFVDGVIGIIKQGHRLLLLFFIINPHALSIITKNGIKPLGCIFGVG